MEIEEAIEVMGSDMTPIEIRFHKYTTLQIRSVGIFFEKVLFGDVGVFLESIPDDDDYCFFVRKIGAEHPCISLNINKGSVPEFEKFLLGHGFVIRTQPR